MRPSRLSSGKRCSASTLTWTTNITARTPSMETCSQTRNRSEAVGRYPRIRCASYRRITGRQDLCLHSVRYRGTQVLLRMRHRGSHATFTNRVEPHLRWRDRITGPLNWELELPLPIPLLDYKE